MRMTKVISEAFIAAGGKLMKAEVKGFNVGPEGPTDILTDQGVIPCDMVVIAAGVPFGQAGTTNMLRLATVWAGKPRSRKKT